MFLNGALTAPCHADAMSAISGIAPAAAPHQAPQREARDNRAPAEFGAAVTHQDLVQAKMRVDPAAAADKQRETKRTRRDDPRDERLERDRAQHADRRLGQRVDIKA